MLTDIGLQVYIALKSLGMLLWMGIESFSDHLRQKISSQRGLSETGCLLSAGCKR